MGVSRVTFASLASGLCYVTCNKSKAEPMPTLRPVKSRERVRVHRARLRRRGLRPIQIWVPDVRSRSFAREAHRQSLLIGRGGFEREDQAFVDAVSEWPPE